MGRMGKSIIGRGLGDTMAWGDELGVIVDTSTGEVIAEAEGDPNYEHVLKDEDAYPLNNQAMSQSPLLGPSTVQTGSPPSSGSGDDPTLNVAGIFGGGGAPGVGVMDMLPMIAVVGGGLLAAFLLLKR